MSTVAQALGVDDWRVGAVKGHTGHSLGAAAGDQLSALLGIWESQWIPGIGTIPSLAPDVHTDRLSFLLDNTPTDCCAYSLVNSKGFGGNNATATVLSPDTSHAVLKGLHGARAIKVWRERHERTQKERMDIESARLAGDWQPLYRFNDGVLDDDDIKAVEGMLTLGDVNIDTQTRVMPDKWRLDT